MKKIVFTLTLLLLNSCKDKMEDISVTSEFTVMTNGFDPLIVSYQKDNIEIDFYGKRDSDGIPVAVDYFLVKQQNDTTSFVLDDIGRPIKIIAYNKAIFELEWISSESAALKIIANDGETEINTEINLSGNAITNKFKKVPSSSVSRKERQLDFKLIQSETSLSRRARRSEFGNCQVSVFSCEEPTNASTYLTIKNTRGKILSGSVPTNSIAKGQYVGSIPSDLAPIININSSDICNTVASVLDKACIAIEVSNLPLFLCPTVSAVVAFSGIGSVIAALISEACVLATTGLEYYCIAINASAASGAPSLADKICNSVFENRSYKEDILISAYATSLPKNLYSQTVQVNGQGPFPDLKIDFGSETQIKSVNLKPSVPVAAQDYTVELNLFCIKPMSIINISVTGSDGYQDRITYKISEISKDAIFKLIVPGAEAGVNDKIEVEIILENGTVLNKETSMVFI